ncbi:hypothetical protein Tco_0756360 [Tanacetum coccineum]
MTHGMLTLPTDESVITYTQLSGVQGVDTQDHVIKDVMRQLSFKKIELDREAGFGDVAGCGICSYRLSLDESFGVDDLDLNLNRTEVDVGRTEVPVYEEADVGRTEHVVELAIVKDVVDDSSKEDAKQGIDSTYETQYLVESTKDADTYDDDKDDDFLHGYFFDNIGATNLVLDDVLEGEDVDVVNPDGFDSDTGNDNEISNYTKRRLDELRREMEGVINVSGQWKYSFCIGQNFASTKKAKDKVYLHSIKSRRMLKLYKNENVRLIARCEGKVHVFTMLQEKIFDQVRINLEIQVKAVQDQLQRDLELQISMSKAFRAKAKREIKGDHQGWFGQAYKDLLWISTSAKTVKDFQECILELKKMNLKAHEWLKKIPLEHWARFHFPGRANSDLLLNNMCEVGKLKKKRKRSKHEDAPFVKDGKLSKKGRTITCQSCGNIGHNKATYKGQGGNNAEASDSASRQAQQSEL